MVELIRSNDTVFLSWLLNALAAAGIEARLFDLHASIADGSIGAVPRRIMVDAADLAVARRLLAEGEALGRGA